MGNVVISLSGGLDSTILTYLLVDQYKADHVFALTFDYNQKHKIELEKAKITANKLGIKHNIVNIDFLADMLKNTSALVQGSNINTPTIIESLGDPQPASYVPFRNLILSSICASYAESVNAHTVYLAFQQQDNYGYWDVSREFISRLNQVFSLNRKNNIVVKAPFATMHKNEEIAIGLNLKVPFEDTISCYNPNENGESCGICLTCSDRIGNFVKAGIKDPVPYSKEIDWNELFNKCAE